MREFLGASQAVEAIVNLAYGYMLLVDALETFAAYRRRRKLEREARRS